MKKQPLYVYRPVSPESAAAIRDWARKEGFKSTLEPDDLHVTVAYSKEPVDWFGAPPNTKMVVANSGTRKIEQFGDAVVLTVPSSRLQMDHKRYRKAGASFDYDAYRPHVTITYKRAGVDLSKVKPFDGEIVFGPERQEIIKDDAGDDVPEVKTAA